MRARSHSRPRSILAATPAALAILLAACDRTAPTAVDGAQPKRPPIAIGGPQMLAAPWNGAGLLFSPTGLDFGDVQVGNSAPDQQVTVTNVSTASMVISMTGGAGGAFGGVQDCQGTTLDPGASCHISYAFSPTTAGDATTSTGGTVNGIPFEFDFTGRGVGPRFRITGTALDFGDVPVGGSQALAVNVTNIGLAPATVSMAGGAAGAFGGVQNCQGITLAVGQSCQITYTFAPTTPGVITGTTGGSINGQPFAFSFRGNGVGPSFRITPTALDFGEVVAGQSVAQPIQVTNTSTVATTISMAGGAAGDFGGFQNCQGVSLAPGASCQITYTFGPTTAGVVTGTTGGSINGQSFSFAFRGTGISTAAARTVPFRIARTALDFGNVQVGHSLDESIDVVNVSSSTVTVSMAGGAAGDFGGVQNCQGVALAPGASCQITYTFAPTAPGVVTGTTGGSINGQAFAFSFRGNGVGPSFRVTPTALDFGALQVGGSLDQSVTVTNVGSAAAVVSMAGGAAGDFGGVQNCQGVSLAPGASCQITYTFAPTTPGVITGTTGGSINGQTFAFAFRGEGLAPHFRVTPFAWDFGPLEVGTTADQSVTVTNDGLAPATVSMAGGAAGPFGGVQNCQGVVLARGASCQITYTFAPTAGGLLTQTTGGTLNGQLFAFTMYGTGRTISPYRFLGFYGRLALKDKFAPGATIPVKGIFVHLDGTPLTRAEGKAIAAACRVQVTFSGAPGLTLCAQFKPDLKKFVADLTLDPALARGDYTVTMNMLDESGTTVIASGSAPITVR